MSTTDTRTLRIYRYKRGDGGEHFDEFEVPVGPHATILDALRWIQLHRDPSLALRHSCLHASCGTCGMRIDGREELACVCAVQDYGEKITVEPLANLPILTDLVVDMDDFFARFREHPIIRASEILPDAQPPDDVDEYVRLEDCIECGLCLSACPVAATSRHYVGPAALVAAQRLLEEPRGADCNEVLAWADRPEAAWGCHLAFECTRACPAEAIPADRIMALRRELVR
jgi:succinate dehydrogenase / fumarate reductase iron-sulfur subunit